MTYLNDRSARLSEALGRLSTYARLGRELQLDERIAVRRKAQLAPAVAHLESARWPSPPDIGQRAAVEAALRAIRYVVRGLPALAADDALASAGLSRVILDRDVDAVMGAVGTAELAWASTGRGRFG